MIAAEQLTQQAVGEVVEIVQAFAQIGKLIGIYCIIAALALMAQKQRTVDGCRLSPAANMP